MFERYAERARRALFFARYEASEIGGRALETEHLLLGVVRERKGFTSGLFERFHVSLEAVRSEIQARIPTRDKVDTSVEIPFSTETQRILRFAVEEAERLGHTYIGTEHLLLGILREPRSLATALLTEKGIQLETVRQEIASLTNRT